jgi:hypothetical protein
MNERPIEHEEAVKNMMAERYLLGELNASQRDAYEEHLFSCNACFEQVKAGTEFVGHLRRIGTEEPAGIGWRGWLRQGFQPISALALAALFFCVAGLSIYQASVIHRMKAPEVVAVTTVPSASRASNKAIAAPRHGNFELRAVFQPKTELGSYRAEVVSASGKQLASLAIKAPETGEVQVRLNAGSFQDGNYILVIRAVDQSTGSTLVIEQYPFELRLQD